jgi:hypothetical protein
VGVRPDATRKHMTPLEIASKMNIRETDFLVDII